MLLFALFAAPVAAQDGSVTRELSFASHDGYSIADAATRLPESVAGLVMYGVLAENMQETARYIFSEGAFLPYERAFDADEDGVITTAEFDADPERFRARVLGNTGFARVDADRDGVFSDVTCSLGHSDTLTPLTEETSRLSTPGLVRAQRSRFRRAGGRATGPYPSMWDFVSRLDVPIGLFQGEADAMTPAGGVRRLEARATEAGKGNMRFHYLSRCRACRFGVCSV